MHAVDETESESGEDDELEESEEHEHFGEVTEVRFPGEVGPLGDRRLCKIRCVRGKWVGPLCATNEEGNCCSTVENSRHPQSTHSTPSNQPVRTTPEMRLQTTTTMDGIMGEKIIMFFK